MCQRQGRGHRDSTVQGGIGRVLTEDGGLSRGTALRSQQHRPTECQRGTEGDNKHPSSGTSRRERTVRGIKAVNVHSVVLQSPLSVAVEARRPGGAQSPTSFVNCWDLVCTYLDTSNTHQMERICLTNIVYHFTHEPRNNLAMWAVESTEPRRIVMAPLAGLSRLCRPRRSRRRRTPQVTVAKKKKPQAFAVAESHDPRNDPTGE